jgi:hypothetical protein
MLHQLLGGKPDNPAAALAPGGLSAEKLAFAARPLFTAR